MKILALDYDGVIADSQMECVFVGFNSYLKIHKDTKLFEGQKITFDNFDELQGKYKEIIEKYKQLRAYVINAFCYYVIAYIIDNNIKIDNQDQYNKLRDKLIKKYNDEYVKYFYEERFGLQDMDFDKWIMLVGSYGKVIEGIKKLEKEYIITIATNNRERTVARFLKKYDIIPRIIVDSNLSSDKKKQLEHIKNELKVNFDDIHFVDDQVGHFSKLIPLGVKCYHATWGYNNKEQREEAKNLGVIMLSEDTFYEELANKNHNV